MSRSAPLLLPYQARWVADASKAAIWEKSRRVGADWCEAMRLVRERWSGDRSVDAMYQAHREQAAREFMAYVASFAASLYGRAMEVIEGVESFDRRDVLVMRVTFPDVRGKRCKIEGMTSAPEALRGFGGDVTISEFAHHSDQDALYQAATPALQWGGRLRIISTHRGATGRFNRLVQGARRHADPERYGQPGVWDPLMTLHRTTIDDAIADGLVERIAAKTGHPMTRDDFREECRRLSGSEQAFAEEYLCEPLVDGGSFLPVSLLAGAVAADDPAPTTSPIAMAHRVLERCHSLGVSTPLYMGCDVARTGDLFTVWALARQPQGGAAAGRLRTLGLLAVRGMSFADMEMAIGTILGACGSSAGSAWRGQPSVSRLAIDATGLGMQLAERMRLQHGPVVQPVTITGPAKADLITRIRSAVERGAVSLPDDQAVLDDLSSVRREVTDSASVRFTAGRTASGHADMAIALGLALRAADARAAVSFGAIPSDYEGVLA